MGSQARVCGLLNESSWVLRRECPMPHPAPLRMHGVPRCCFMKSFYSEGTGFTQDPFPTVFPHWRLLGCCLPVWTKLQAGVWSCRAAHGQGLGSIQACSGPPTVLGVPFITSTHFSCPLCLLGLTLPTYKWIKEESLHSRAQPCKPVLPHPTLAVGVIWP